MLKAGRAFALLSASAESKLNGALETRKREGHVADTVFRHFARSCATTGIAFAQRWNLGIPVLLVFTTKI